jgi:hypothetical protein
VGKKVLGSRVSRASPGQPVCIRTSYEYLRGLSPNTLSRMPDYVKLKEDISLSTYTVKKRYKSENPE